MGEAIAGNEIIIIAHLKLYICEIDPQATCCMYM